MKVLVAVKRSIDPNIKVRVKADGSDVELAGVKMALNPFCEIAVEEAVRLKERGIAQEVVVVTVGSKAAQEQLRVALALGADRALQVELPGTLEPLNVAKALTRVVERERPDLVLFGKQAIDQENGQTGQMLAQLAGLPQATCASALSHAAGEWIVECEIDGGRRTVALRSPAVVTCDLRLNEPRYASLPAIMKAKKKPLEVLDAAALGVTAKVHSRLLGVQPPIQRTAGIRVQSVDELVSHLKQRAGVL
ncbi:electron transfer flavoprotein subunit beta/FixA family protein [uncultured Pseudomonas sp.]|uniref:electron transfer flavoprotein subunit beta/FixA family protein n=1 Tax=uncultured Pseudomonas sp. TaxID=114707 RepID=UPI0025845096|nr:electron transfer flavoprotein subunit beta/FixA family protein [uncultured Pseudomonas sp.]